MSIKLVVENYRRFRRICWSLPKGVSLLVGPNGSGKSTLLKAFQFVCDYVGRDLEKAIEFSGGSWGLKHLGGDEEDPVRFEIEVGDLEWLIELKATRGERIARERVARAGEVLIEQHAGAERFLYGQQEVPVGFGSALGKVASLVPEFRSAVDSVLTPFEHYRLYEDPHLWPLRKSGSPESSDDYLHRTGQNAFTVLRNWSSGTREQKERYAYVEEGLKAAFPYLFAGFVLRSVARTVVADFYHPDHEEPFPFDVAPHGLLVAMIHLLAVASAPTGGLVAIDEFENGLHPKAVSILLEHVRDRADELDLTVLIASHSITVLNEFNEDKAKVFVLEIDQGQGEWPVPLLDAGDPDWLAHFAPGDRYGRDFAKQPSRR